jgi:hypothetical protein
LNNARRVRAAGSSNPKGEGQQVKKLVLAVVALFSMPIVSNAAPINGSFDVFVTDSFINPNIVGFYITSNVGYDITLTGDFVGLGPNLLVTPQNNYTYIFIDNIGTGSDLFCGANCIMVLQGNGLNAWLNATTHVYNPVTGEVDGMGIMHLDGFDPTPAEYALGITYAPGSLQNFSVATYMPPDPVPGPIVGTGLPGLLCLGMLWLARKHQQRNGKLA